MYTMLDTRSLRVMIVLMWCITFVSVSADSPQKGSTIQISVPKTGTHLFYKCLSLLKEAVYTSNFAGLELPAGFYWPPADVFEKLTSLPKWRVWITHLMYSDAYAERMLQKKCTLFFIYRDPRDQIISLMHYMKKRPKMWPLAASMSQDELIMDMICEGVSYNDHPPAHGINDLYQKYLPWLTVPGIYAVKFEDLVGSQGGGNDEVQYRVITEIAHHAGIPYTDETIQHVVDNLFGRYTFREGKIGSWKKYFTEKHKEAFKQHAGQLLIDLGYEKDMAW